MDVGTKEYVLVEEVTGTAEYLTLKISCYIK
jgi:hypothetical protein